MYDYKSEFLGIIDQNTPPYRYSDILYACEMHCKKLVSSRQIRDYHCALHKPSLDPEIKNWLSENKNMFLFENGNIIFFDTIIELDFITRFGNKENIDFLNTPYIEIFIAPSHAVKFIALSIKLNDYLQNL